MSDDKITGGFRDPDEDGLDLDDLPHFLDLSEEMQAMVKESKPTSIEAPPYAPAPTQPIIVIPAKNNLPLESSSLSRVEIPLRHYPEEPGLFRLTSLFLPRRLWAEEQGDALEELYNLRQNDAPIWQIRLKIMSTTAWTLVNALREVMSAVTGQARERKR